MQKFSFAFVCCMILLFTACKKETLLETNQDLNPKKSLTSNTSSATSLKEVIEAQDAELDFADSVSTENIALKDYKKFILESVNACFGPITGICGSPTVYNSCYYSYQIWNDPTKLYVDLYFPSSVVGRRTDCYGTICQYYVAPCITLDLFDSNGTKIGTVNVATSTISVRETRISFNLASLQSQYPTLKCVKLNGFFYRMKKCGNCSPQRVGTVCISPKQFCLQQCPPPPQLCPVVNSITVDRTKICGSGSVNGSASITETTTSAITTWTVDGQTFTGKDFSYNFPQNNSCNVITKTITAKVVCSSNQNVLAERTFNVNIHPKLTATVEVDNLYCQAIIGNINCPSDLVNISWILGNDSGTGNIVNVNYELQTLKYTISDSGCSFDGESEVQCFPLFKNNTPKSTH